MRALNEFHSDPMYQHLLGPSEDPELSAQTQQDLKMLHAVLGNKKADAPVVAKKPPTKPAGSKPAVPKPAAPKRAAPKPVVHEAVAPKPVAHKQAAPKPVAAKPVPKVAAPAVIQPKPPAPKPAVVQPKPPAAKPAPPVHVAQKTVPKHAAPKPVVHAPHPAQVHAQQETPPKKQPVAPARKAAFRPAAVPAKKVEQPKSHGAKFWSEDMDAGHEKKKLSHEDELEARVAEQATETRAEMEKEIAATDEEFPVKVHQSFSHVAKTTDRSFKTRKEGLPEGYGTKTVPMEGNPSQGVRGQYVAHEDGKTMTKDWGTEYGGHPAEQEQQAPPPAVKGGSLRSTAVDTVSIVALLILVAML